MKLFFKGFIFTSFVIFYFLSFIDQAVASTTNELFTAKINNYSSWQNVSNILGSPDSQYASITGDALTLTGTVNVPFNIPLGSTINSVSVKIYQNSYGNSGYSNLITITNRGVEASCGSSPSFLLNNTTQVIVFNQTNCKKFSTIATITQLNSGRFGWWITNSGTKNASFDAISMWVDYDPLVIPTLDIRELNSSPGSVWEWPTATISAVKKEGLSDIVFVSVGKNHNLALKKDGTVWAWGSNSNGQLGIGTFGENLVYPVQVKSPDGLGYLTDVKAIAAGELYSIVLKNDGAVWAWGANGYRRIGTENETDKVLLPSKVISAGFSQIIAIAAGNYHSIALKSDGSVFTWGSNAEGQTGTGYSPNTSTIVSPRKIMDNAKSVAAGNMHILIVKNDGTVWGSGRISSGQLGAIPSPGGWATSVGLPVQVPEITGVESVWAKDNTSMAIAEDGTVYEWGSGRWTENADPRQIPGLDDVRMISNGSYFTGYVGIALKNDGAVWMFDVQTLIAQQVSGFSNIGFVYGGSGTPSLAVVKISESTPTPTPTPIPKTPLVIIPGIGGSEFKSNEAFTSDIKDCGILPEFSFNAGDVVWVNTAMAGISSCDDYFDVLKLKTDGQAPEYSKIILNGNLFEGAYGNTIKFFTDNGYELGKTLFLFPYDWRLDIAGTLTPLNDLINTIKTQTGSQKVDILAHSMGGLVARNYISDVARALNVRKLFTLGTPHLGAVDFLKNLRFGGCLTQGFWSDIADYGICLGVSQTEVKDIIQNMISGYELAPSQEYFNFYNGQDNNHLFPYRSNGQQLDYDQIKSFFTGLGYNTGLFAPSELFHTLDNQLTDTNSVEIINIAGSGLRTWGQIIEREAKNLWDKIIQKKDGFSVNGDKTVPLFSASLIDYSNNKSLLGNAKVFYTRQDHGELVASGSALNLVKNVLEDNSYLPDGISVFPYPFSGTEFSVYSPVNINIYDSFGNHTGPTIDGDFEENIPGSSYETLDDAKFIFLPNDGSYDIKFESTGEGSFDFKIRKYGDDEITNEILYKDIPLTEDTKAETEFDTSFLLPPIIQLDENGDGEIDSNINSSSILAGDAIYDEIPPTTDFQISGILGNSGWFKSDVNVILNPQDESTGSGILKTEHSLDNGQTVNIYSGPFTIDSEKINKLKFRSVDNAGNEEYPKEIEIKIDKTPPEVKISVDPDKQDLIVAGIDANPTAVTRSNNALTKKRDDAFYTITDTAGNSLKLDVRERERVKLDRFRIYSVQYNDDPIRIFGINHFNVVYNGRKQRVNVGEQNLELKGEIKIRIRYDSRKNKSTIVMKELNQEKIKEVKNGLIFLQLLTARGQLKTAY